MVTETIQNNAGSDSDTDNSTQNSPEDISMSNNTGLSSRNMTVMVGLVLAVIVAGIFIISTAIEGGSAEATTMADSGADEVQAMIPDPSASATSVSSGPAPYSGADEILRQGEGRLFYTTIQIPANAETLYVSGSGASPDEDGNWGDMEAQTIDTFNKFKTTLEERGWSMADIVQVRAFAVAGEYGLLDFDGFNRGYLQFFGTGDNPNKPVRSFVQVADLVVDGWLIEIEIRAARTPD